MRTKKEEKREKGRIFRLPKDLKILEITRELEEAEIRIRDGEINGEKAQQEAKTTVEAVAASQNLSPTTTFDASEDLGCFVVAGLGYGFKHDSKWRWGWRFQRQFRT